MSKKIELTANDIFNKWVNYLKEEFKGRYIYKERKDHIGHLIYMLKTAQIAFDDAKTVRNNVMVALTTVEGRRGLKRYKGWKENVFSDFDSILADTYIEIDETAVKEAYDKDEDVVKWVNDKYGANDLLIAKAHEVGTLLNLEYLEENFS